MMRRRMRFAAVLVAVVFALTGFSARGHGHGGSSGSSGGGCSNSHKSNGGYHHTTYNNNDYDDDDYDDDDYDDDYGSSSTSSGGSTYDETPTPTPTPTASADPDVRVIRCAQPRKGKHKAVTSSKVEISSDSGGTFDIEVTFQDYGVTVDTGHATVEVEPGEVKTLTVRMEHPSELPGVNGCEVTADLA
ncbi:MAG TPA: hypothetical protein VIS29_18160 [Streptomyces sp.]